ncbi:hypothetical protein [Clostridium estertheticum]|uniref:Uncharacterized protein n=1 Tax=Clostridium estertheticum TaxID=238834 RepID=A0AA47EJ74_9CLOT|nr:hypothetical protein [Clostridium estertheticum]MBU3155158.1 hypothetical protein [Clostridium estertheticum]WAG61212.1 hypothetical protein LL038_02885 [Clostridium estertheticum]
MDNKTKIAKKPGVEPLMGGDNYMAKCNEHPNGPWLGHCKIISGDADVEAREHNHLSHNDQDIAFVIRVNCKQ